MMKIIKLLGYEDYFYTIKKGEEYNTTNKIELHSLNSDNYLEKGFLKVLLYVLKFKYMW